MSRPCGSCIQQNYGLLQMFMSAWAQLESLLSSLHSAWRDLKKNSGTRSILETVKSVLGDSGVLTKFTRMLTNCVYVWKGEGTARNICHLVSVSYSTIMIRNSVSAFWYLCSIIMSITTGSVENLSSIFFLIISWWWKHSLISQNQIVKVFAEDFSGETAALWKQISETTGVLANSVKEEKKDGIVNYQKQGSGKRTVFWLHMSVSECQSAYIQRSGKVVLMKVFWGWQYSSYSQYFVKIKDFLKHVGTGGIKSC